MLRSAPEAASRQSGSTTTTGAEERQLEKLPVLSIAPLEFTAWDSLLPVLFAALYITVSPVINLGFKKINGWSTANLKKQKIEEQTEELKARTKFLAAEAVNDMEKERKTAEIKSEINNLDSNFRNLSERKDILEKQVSALEDLQKNKKGDLSQIEASVDHEREFLEVLKGESKEIDRANEKYKRLAEERSVLKLLGDVYSLLISIDCTGPEEDERLRIMTIIGNFLNSDESA